MGTLEPDAQSDNSRSVALENEIEAMAANARYQGGVLEWVLPKKVAVAAKRLAIQ